MKYYMRLLLFKYIYLVFGLYPCIDTQLDLCYSSAHEISTAAVHTYIHELH